MEVFSRVLAKRSKSKFSGLGDGFGYRPYLIIIYLMIYYYLFISVRRA